MSNPYSTLISKLSLPHPDLHRHVITTIFHKLTSDPTSPHFCHVISQCLTSQSTSAVDQSIRELCKLFKNGRIDGSVAILELHAALDGCDSKFVAVFVKAIGFVCRVEFERDPNRVHDSDVHPFIKVLSCREEAQTELIQQVILFITHNITAGMGAVAKYLRPFFMFAVIRKPSTISSYTFARDLISAVASLACSFPYEAIEIIKLLTDCVMYLPCSNEGEFIYLICSAQYVVDSIMVVLKQLVTAETQLTCAARECSIDLVVALFSMCTYSYRPHNGIEFICELSKRFLVAQKEFGLHYLPQFARITVSISVILTQVEFEHELLSILKLLIFLFEWKTRNEHKGSGEAYRLSEELLYIFPVISLLSSPSKSVKAAATFLLSALERILSGLLNAPTESVTSKVECLHMNKPMTFPSRLLHHLWFQEQPYFTHSTYLGFYCNTDSKIEGATGEPNYWTCKLRAYLLTVEKLRQSSANRLAGTCLLLCSILSTLVMHPILGSSSVDSLSAIGLVSPEMGMPLLQALLFHNKMLCCYKSNSPEMLLRLYEMLPSLASHSALVPLILQTILPMLQKNAKPVLYATGIRLLCKTWIATDRVFVSLQDVLHPKALSDFMSERQICISIASTARDVCRHNPDRGVDLILTVSACIESRDSTVQALGFESLAYLCGADIVDFYTAWDVIEKHSMDYSSDPIIAYGVCSLLRWGAVDASAYPEMSKVVIQILWNVATSEITRSVSLWAKARASAFQSLSHYEVEHVKNVFPDFKETNLQCLFAEDNVRVLKAMEEFEAKVIDYEHINRRRGHNQKQIVVRKVDKLLNVFPHVIFSQGNHKVNASELPGAALFSLQVNPKDVQGISKELAKLHSAYEKALLEISESLRISRNILVALLALQSWKAFFHRWIVAAVTLENAKGSSIVDKSTKAVNYIFQILCKAATEAIPRVSVNIALAMGALCTVMPPATQSVTLAASSFLLKWLDDNEHEHRQWSAAISLGLVSNCLHATDKSQKFKVITELLKSVCRSKSFLVKGACGIGMGFACQDLLARVEIDNPNFEEKILLSKIIRTLCAVLSQLCPSISESLKHFSKNFLICGNDTLKEDFLDFPLENYENLEDDAWGIAGLVMGLGNSTVAIYRFGAYDSVLKINEMLISWIPHVHPSVQSTIFCREMTEVPLSIGACIALPSVMEFCYRKELTENDFEALIHRYTSLISGLLCSKKTGTLYQNILMASCIGAGSFLSYVSTDGKHSSNFDNVKHLLEILRDAYTHPYPSYVNLGAMLGVVNAFGAGAGDLNQTNKQASSFITGSLSSSPECETLSTSMVQELFLLAKESRDQQIKQNSAWAISFLREKWCSSELHDSDSKSGITDTSARSQNFADDSLVLKLCLWLRDIELNKTNEMVHANTITTVLRCLSKAPRLPTLDWGVIIRRCMRRGTKLSINIREECICFSLVHAYNITSLVLFLDELTELSRFKSLEINLQSTLLYHISDLLKLFSGSKLEKLSDDLVAYVSSSDCPVLLRVSFWKGLHHCFNGTFEELNYMSYIGKCMECLFHMLPVLNCESSSQEEVFEAITCLSKTPQGWLMHLLQVPNIDTFYGQCHTDEVAKRISTTARLVKIGCIPMFELDKMKAYVLSTKFEGASRNVLLDVAAAVSTTDGNTKMQWLLDALEISLIAEYPSVALRFVGILSGVCCKYMPLLMINPDNVLIDLPITLTSLLSENSWKSIAESAANKLWASTERACMWAAHAPNDQEGISDEEATYSALLAHSLHQTCVALRNYLPLQKQLKLANLNIPTT